LTLLLNVLQAVNRLYIATVTIVTNVITIYQLIFLTVFTHYLNVLKQSLHTK